MQGGSECFVDDRCNPVGMSRFTYSDVDPRKHLLGQVTFKMLTQSLHGVLSRFRIIIYRIRRIVKTKFLYDTCDMESRSPPSAVAVHAINEYKVSFVLAYPTRETYYVYMSVKSYVQVVIKILPAEYPTNMVCIEHIPCYTLLLVDTCTRSWKEIEVMPDAASDLATRLA